MVGGPHNVSRTALENAPTGVWRYGAFLPQAEEEAIVTLGEGGTPLLPAERLGSELGLRNLLIKDESRNPTGSFMDRGSTVLLTQARKQGVQECSCTTTGNLGASLAAYCARADIRARISVHQNTDQGKLYQMLAYGAELEQMGPHPSAGARRSRRLEVTAGNPYLLEGEKTTGFEIVQDLGWLEPDVIVVPMGTGGHLLMIWRAILELSEAGLLKKSKCRLLGVQVQSSVQGGTPLAELEGSEPIFRKQAAEAIAASRGGTITASLGSTIAATGTLAKTEGIFAEPSSASVIPALSSAIRDGDVDRDEAVVCVITGAGLKDPRALFRLAREARRVPLGDSYARPSPQIGETKFSLVRLLQARPSYGYELRNQLATQRRMSNASVYQHLAELEAFGMVRRKGIAVKNGRERVLYELTRRGHDYLRIAGKLQRAVQAR